MRWIVDPIDGTRNFLRGVPVWATLVALERDGGVVCAVVSAPALGHRWWAAAGEGAWRDGERIHVSAVERLADAAVACTYARDLAAVEPRVWHARGLGDFWQHVLVAEGALDGAVDAHLKVWDFTAVGLIVAEAGGRASALDGGAARANEQFVSLERRRPRGAARGPALAAAGRGRGAGAARAARAAARPSSERSRHVAA